MYFLIWTAMGLRGILIVLNKAMRKPDCQAWMKISLASVQGINNIFRLLCDLAVCFIIDQTGILKLHSNTDDGSEIWKANNRYYDMTSGMPCPTGHG